MAGAAGDKGSKENIATKALGVLLENGPYGMVLHLESQKQDGSRAIAQEYRKQLLELLGQGELRQYFPPPPSNPDLSQLTAWLREVAGNLDRYLFLKRLWQQTLTYARYHAKASDDGAKPGK